MRILLVEDDNRVATALCAVLGRHGFVTTRVSGVAEALERLDNHTDVVLVDLMLPDGDGFGLIYSIRAARDVPIIVVTARAELRWKLHGLHLGADDYLVKPYDARELIARIGAVVRRGAAHSPPPVIEGVVEVKGVRILRLVPTRFAPVTPGGMATQTISGHLDTGAADFVYLPVDVPDGVREIAVSYSYDKPPVPPGTLGNSCDIGIFDERGIDLGGHGFRGWSGGSRTEFAISAESATPGYLPGPVNAGRWHIVLGPYQIAPPGLNYQVQVTLTLGPDGTPFRPRYPPQRIAGRLGGWYRGDCHLHTVYSDGRRLPSEVAAGARAAGLDFIVTTEHNTSSSHGVWGPLAGDDLLIITGEEITTRNGHYLGLGLPPGEWIDWRYRARDEDDYTDATRQIHRSGGIVVPAHPYCASVACRWKFGYDEADAIEVWNGPWTADDESALDTWDSMLAESARSERQWLPAMGNSDAHSEPQVIGLPHNVVLSEGLSRDALLDGIRSGRNWIAESSTVTLTFSATSGSATAGIGERLAAAELAPVDVALEVSGVPNGVVRLISDEGQVMQTSLPASGAGTVTYRTTPSLAAYIRAEVRHLRPDGTPGNGNGTGPDLQLGAMAALTNPIFLGRSPGQVRRP